MAWHSLAILNYLAALASNRSKGKIKKNSVTRIPIVLGRQVGRLSTRPSRSIHWGSLGNRMFMSVNSGRFWPEFLVFRNGLYYDGLYYPDNLFQILSMLRLEFTWAHVNSIVLTEQLGEDVTTRRNMETALGSFSIFVAVWCRKVSFLEPTGCLPASPAS